MPYHDSQSNAKSADELMAHACIKLELHVFCRNEVCTGHWLVHCHKAICAFYPKFAFIPQDCDSDHKKHIGGFPLVKG